MGHGLRCRRSGRDHQFAATRYDIRPCCLPFNTCLYECIHAESLEAFRQWKANGQGLIPPGFAGHMSTPVLAGTSPVDYKFTDLRGVPTTNSMSTASGSPTLPVHVPSPAPQPLVLVAPVAIASPPLICLRARLVVLIGGGDHVRLRIILSSFPLVQTVDDVLAAYRVLGGASGPDADQWKEIVGMETADHEEIDPGTRLSALPIAPDPLSHFPRVNVYLRVPPFFTMSLKLPDVDGNAASAREWTKSSHLMKTIQQ